MMERKMMTLMISCQLLVRVAQGRYGSVIVLTRTQAVERRSVDAVTPSPGVLSVSVHFAAAFLNTIEFAAVHA